MKITDPAFAALPEEVQKAIRENVPSDRIGAVTIITEASSEEEVQDHLHDVMNSLSKAEALGIISLLLDLCVSPDRPEPPKGELVPAVQLMMFMAMFDKVRKALSEIREEQEAEKPNGMVKLQAVEPLTGSTN